MDQAASALGQKDHLIKLDCAKLVWEFVPFKLTDAKLLIINTGVKHNLADGEYNKRRKECSEALAIIQSAVPSISSLAECDPLWLKENSKLLPELLFKRALHVASEQRRVLEVSNMLAKGDLVNAGKLMTASHRSLQYDYEVSCDELDFLVDNALGIADVYGARMTGGGFGGCMIVLLDNASETKYRESLSTYKSKYGIEPLIIEAIPSDGAIII
jgi:galactokinase